MDLRVTETLHTWGLPPHERDTRFAQYVFPTWAHLERFTELVLPRDLHGQYDQPVLVSSSGNQYDMAFHVLEALYYEATPQNAPAAAFIMRALSVHQPRPNQYRRSAKTSFGTVSDIPAEYLTTVFPDQFNQFGIDNAEAIFFATRYSHAEGIPADYLRALQLETSKPFWDSTRIVQLYSGGIPADYAHALKDATVKTIEAAYSAGISADYVLACGNVVPAADIIAGYDAGISPEYLIAAIGNQP